MKKLKFSLIACLWFTMASAQDSYNVKLTPKIILNESFSDNSNKWPQYKGDTAEILLMDGGYLHNATFREILIPRPANEDLRKISNYYQLRVETTAMENSVAFYGLAFGVKNKGNYNAYLINSQGDFVIREVKEGTTKDLIKGKSEKINTGRGAKNILTVETSYGYFGFGVSYFVNGSNVRIFTAAEDAEYEAKKKKVDENAAPLITMAGIDEMFAGSLDVKGAGIALLTKQGATVLYDNFELQVMPNKGAIVMVNNPWKPNMADIVYLKKDLQLELKKEQDKWADNEKKGTADKISAAQKLIAALSADRLTPPVGGGKKFIPNLDAVIWLKDMLFQIDNNPPFSYYQEKEETARNNSETEYRIRHRLPDITGNCIAVAAKNKTTLYLMLGNNLTEVELRNLMAQYLVNLSAAAGSGKYLDPKPEEKDPHMIGVGTGGKSFLSGRNITPILLPKINEAGTWQLRLIITAE